jgi:hypothetical protein
VGSNGRRFRFNDRGTRFQIYAHSPGLGFEPECVFVDAPPGSIRPGPADDVIAVIDALDKPCYYTDAGKLRKRPRYPYPPAAPRATEPVEPEGGHFDHLKPSAWQFSSAMAYAAIRTTLSVWRHFFGLDRIVWHFTSKVRPTLQVHPRVECANAWSGDGFLEFGFPRFPDRRNRFCHNLEVVAHETGHLIMKAVVGTMPDDEKSLQHRAHEEAAADLIALVTALHFESVVTRTFDDTAGFLFSANILSRFGEWGRGPRALPRQSFNDDTMASVRAEEPLTKHALSAPFTGAVFDAFVGMFVRHLLERGAIDEPLAAQCRHQPDVPVPDLRADFRRQYRRHEDDFAEALRQARDDLGWLLASAWQRSTAGAITYSTVLANLLQADADLRIGHGKLLHEVFGARGIVP